MKFALSSVLLAVIGVISVYGDTYLPPKSPPSPPSSGPYPPSGQGAGATPSAPAAPYPPSGWKPTGQQFQLPSRQQKISPPSTYGLPTTKPVTTIGFQELEEPTTLFNQDQTPPPKYEAESETVNKVSAQLQASDSGVYYVLLPDGRLQRVSYTTMPLQESFEKLQQVGSQSGQVKPNGFVANVKYQDVEPITGPIYTYNSAPLVRVY